MRRTRSAEFHYAVSQISNLLRARTYQGSTLYQRSAEYNSAIQIKNLRYENGAPSNWPCQQSANLGFRISDFGFSPHGTLLNRVFAKKSSNASNPQAANKGHWNRGL
jgi:hypothetical protein